VDEMDIDDKRVGVEMMAAQMEDQLQK